jgi:butyrate kinase
MCGEDEARMEKTYKILTINPGSTSTKVAVFENEKKLFQEDIEHKAEDLAGFKTIPEQLPFRRDVVASALKNAGYDIADFDVFVGRGGSLNPCEGGTYEVKDLLLEHARVCYAVKHPAGLGSVIAHEYAQVRGAYAYTVDPPDIDEFDDIASISGIKDVPRESHVHALNQKEAARQAARDLGKTYDTSELIVAHIGGGISVGVHKGGRIIDGTNLAYGEGPMAPTRCGTIPALRVVEMIKKGVTPERIRDYVLKDGGMFDHLGTSDMREVERMIADGDEYAKLVRDGLIYHIAKSIGALSVALCGKLDAIVLTGGIVHSKSMVKCLRERVEFIAPVLAYPGEFEMEALANGALRVLRGAEQPKIYRG